MKIIIFFFSTLLGLGLCKPQNIALGAMAPPSQSNCNCQCDPYIWNSNGITYGNCRR